MKLKTEVIIELEDAYGEEKCLFLTPAQATDLWLILLYTLTAKLYAL